MATTAKSKLPAGKLTAKVFKAGNSTAVRLPAALKLKSKTFIVEETMSGFYFTDPAVEKKRLQALRELRGSCPDFPDHTT